LPFEAHWGRTNLPPGNYSFALNSGNDLDVLKISHGKNGLALVTSVARDNESSGPSELIVVRNSAGCFVSELRLREIGLVLQYSPRQPGRQGRAAREREIAQMVPVSVSGRVR